MNRLKAKSWKVESNSGVLEPECPSKRLESQSLAVKSTGHGGLKTSNFCGVCGPSQSLCHFPKFLRAQLPSSRQFNGELNHLRLFVRLQLFNLLDDFSSFHGARFGQMRP